MRRLRNKGRWLRWIAVIAALSNVLAGALGHAPAKAAVADRAGGVSPLLCTSHGLQTVPQDGSTDSTGGENVQCTVCVLLAGFALAPAVALAFAAVLFPTRIFPRLRSGARTLADHLSLGGIRSRAPPHPA